MCGFAADPLEGMMPQNPEVSRSSAAAASAFLVHILTASGAAFGLLALVAAASQRWTEMFLWLGLALAIDGIDGPLARRMRVKERLPRWSGDILDLVVDYLTYVLVPAYALVSSGLLTPTQSYIAGALITVTGVLYFADTRMKTEDAYFRGFPAVWNVIVFYLLVFRPEGSISLAIVALFSALTFVPVLFLHPIRVRRLRALNFAMLAIWVALSAAVLYFDLMPPVPVAIAFLATGLYFLLAGFARSPKP